MGQQGAGHLEQDEQRLRVVHELWPLQQSRITNNDCRALQPRLLQSLL